MPADQTIFDALTILNALANRSCERKVYHPGPTQPCTQSNRCLTCRARQVNAKLYVLPDHPHNRG